MKKIKLIHLAERLSACLCVAALLAAMVYVIPSFAESATVWDGNTNTASVSYDGGDGTEDNPFLISNGSQLYKMVAESSNAAEQQFYKLTADIYLNDVSKANWTSSAKSWYTTSDPDKYKFGHVFNGAGHTVYGLYINSSNFIVGLIPSLTSGAKIGNLTISDAYVKTSHGYAGALAGRVAQNHGTVNVTVTAAAVVDSTVAGSGWTLSSAAFIGLAVGPLSIDNSYVNGCDITQSGVNEDAGAFVGDTYYPGSVTLKKCYSLGTFPVSPFKGQAGHASYYTLLNVFSDAEAVTDAHKAVEGVKAITADDIKGEKAKETFKKFDFEYTWATVENGAPTLVKKSEGLSSFDTTVAGQVWSGNPSRDFGGGSGTADDPYIIATGGHLSKLCQGVSTGETYRGVYFKMTQNIFLNDTSYEGWQEDANQWYVSAVGLGKGFAGYFDGDGHIVSGMYIKRQGSYCYAGLFPTMEYGSRIERVGLVNSEVTLDKSMNETVAGGIVGSIASAEPGVDDATAYIGECFADSTVSLTGYCAGAMVCYGAQPVIIENCYFTGSWDPTSPTAGALMGRTWAYGSFKMNNCYVAAQVPNAILGSSNFNTQKYANCYTLTFQSDPGVVSLYNVSKMNGEAAKDNMVGFDFENIWVTRDGEGETPGLKAFEANKHLYSNKHDFDKIDEIHYTTVTFVTYTDEEIEPIVGTMFESLTLPEMPARNGYEFLGWYTDATLMLEYPIDYIPAYDITLYAKWKLIGIDQGFEDYPATEYDMGEDYEHYKLGVDNFSSDYVKSGARSLHRIGKDTSDADFLIFYENELQVGKKYTMTFWVTTDEESVISEAALVHNTWPDIYEPDAGVGRRFKLKLKKGVWKQYTCTFTAQTKWVSLRISGGHSIFFDDFFLYTNGEDGTVYNLKPVVDEKTDGAITPVIDDTVFEAPTVDSDTDVSEEPSTDIDTSTPDTENEPKKDTPKKDTSASEKEEDNYIWLYIVIGVGVLVVIAAATVLIIIAKKKKK